MEKFFGITNFTSYQHYKERDITSWIKLYFKILDDYKVIQLEDNERWIFVGLLLLAGKNGNNIPADYMYIAEQICHRNSRNSIEKTIQKLIQFNLLYEKSLDVVKSVSTPIRVDKSRLDKKDIYILVLEHWNAQGLVKHIKINDRIVKKIDARLNDGYSIEKIKEVIQNYSTIVKGEQYYFNYKWTLWDFLQRGFEKFKDIDIAKNNFAKFGLKTQLAATKGKYSDIGKISNDNTKDNKDDAKQ